MNRTLYVLDRLIQLRIFDSHQSPIPLHLFLEKKMFIYIYIYTFFFFFFFGEGYIYGPVKVKKGPILIYLGDVEVVVWFWKKWMTPPTRVHLPHCTQPHCCAETSAFSFAFIFQFPWCVCVCYIHAFLIPPQPHPSSLSLSLSLSIYLSLLCV